VVRVIKRIGELEYWAVFELRSGRQMLALQSMWIRGRPPTLRPWRFVVWARRSDATGLWAS